MLNKAYENKRKVIKNDKYKKIPLRFSLSININIENPPKK
jgi:hypothetical protein